MNSRELGIHDVPIPELRPGGILVKTSFSAISAGTERAQLRTASKSLLGKAVMRPDLTRQVLEYARSNGVREAYRKVRARLDTVATLGYSCSGVVIGVGTGVSGFSCGDRVACAGAGYARHAEINWIPQNLAARVPEGVSLQAAAFSTIGAIALHGFRQSGAALGETVVVIGAGLVGALTVQLARSAGCRVVAVDTDPERAKRAASFGANLALTASDPRLLDEVKEFSRYGADVAIIAADTTSNQPVELAARLLRDRGRIVIVGTVSMNVDRGHLYRKELSLAMSRSYGPGRYDSSYEEDGHDYPVGYVRWTEKRNLEAFLDLLSSGRLEVSAFLQRSFDFSEASAAFSDLRSSGDYTAILKYQPGSSQVTAAKPYLIRTALPAGTVRIGCIGAGSFAREYIFPNLRGVPGVELHSVASASGVSAEVARRRFDFSRACTAGEMLEDSGVNAVFVLSRNQTHAGSVVQALRNGKQVFVEKPLAVTRAQLEEINLAWASSHSPFLMVGFNRRFAPATERVRQFFARRREPVMVNIRVNAGYVDRDHWVQHRDEGGRVVGELCHFVDWARFVVGHPIRSVFAVSIPDGERYRSDNLTATLSFADGSLANLVYLANGSPSVSKEYYEVFCQGMCSRLDDFRTLELSGRDRTKRFRFAHDKGHRGELRCVLECMRSGRESPIPFQEMVEVTETTFLIDEILRGAQTSRDSAAVQTTTNYRLNGFEDAVRQG